MHNRLLSKATRIEVFRLCSRELSQTCTFCKFSREAGFLPYIGHAHYIYECYLKEPDQLQSPSIRLRSEHRLVPSGRFGQGLAKGMFLGSETISVTTRTEWHHVSCHSSTLCCRRWGADALLWMRHFLCILLLLLVMMTRCQSSLIRPVGRLYTDP